MKRLFLGSLGALAVGLLLSALVAYASADVHRAIMLQISQSGLASELDNHYQNRWLTATHQGQLSLAENYCPGCGLMHYDGTLFHGLGTLLDQRLAIASAHYQLQWPDLLLEPALPPLQLRTQHGLLDGFQNMPPAQLKLAESNHAVGGFAANYQLMQAGLDGEIQAGRLALSSPALQLLRDEQDWLELLNLQITAAADEKLIVVGDIAQAQLANWQWQGENLQVNYHQQGGRQALDADIRINAEKGRLGQKAHAQAEATVALQQLNLDATLAFARELPALLSPHTSGAARMLGLFSLYSLHGPGFFSPHPALRLHADSIPVSLGLLDADIDLAVTRQTRRPPMHPLEWRQALKGHIKITAPPQQLAEIWQWAAQFMNYVTGLPRRYSQLQQQAWVKKLPDGRDRLLIVLDPATGPRPE